MAKTLVIAEKPSVAKDIAAALPGRFSAGGDAYESDRYVVSFAVGHLVAEVDPEGYDERFKRWRFDDLPIVPETFKHAARDAKSKKQLAVLHRLIARDDIDEIVNACDAGREGELIFKLILETAPAKKKAGKPVRRAWFSSMTKGAIRDAFEHLRDDAQMQPLEAAARARSEADWLVGMNATRAATTRVGSPRNTISLGRVQTPTLALIARRDVEIDAFVPEDYWQVRATFETVGGDRYSGIYHDGSKNRLGDAERAEAVAATARAAGSGRVVSVQRKPVTQIAPLLFDLTSLQREANQRFGFTARRTLSAAQALYEQHKLLTYPRTDSKFVTSDMIGQLRSVAGHVGRASSEYVTAAAYVTGLEKLPLGRIVDDAKVKDHHAIIPTDTPQSLGGLDGDERKIYDLVARRFLAAFHPTARFEATTVETEAPESEQSFRSSGRVLVEAGWRAVYGESVAPADRAGDDDERDDQQLPPLDEGAPVRVASVEALAKQTKPPARYNESSLLRSMETAGRLVDDDEAAEAMAEGGLGTPATRAAIIERLIDVTYIERHGKQLLATPKGRGVIAMLGDHPLTQPALTGQWEQRLASIERGEEDRGDFMDGIVDFTRAVVGDFAHKDRTALVIEKKVIAPCPRCDGDIVERPKSFGCTSWRSKAEPGCGFVIWRQQGRTQVTVEQALERIARNDSDSDRSAEREVLGPCPNCDGLIVERQRSYGCTSWKSRTETGCGYVIWKSTRTGGDVDLETARAMVARGETNAAPAAAKREPLAPCPLGDGVIIDRGKGWGCDSWKSKKNPGCGTVIWKRQAGRVLTEDDARAELALIAAAHERETAASAA